MESLEDRVSRIEKRNALVELDKAWETSWTRRLLIILFTYGAIGTFLGIINFDDPWLSAIVPAIAFTLSTFTMPIFKKMWEKMQTKK